jgi:periplasmic copper chaperone A
MSHSHTLKFIALCAGLMPAIPAFSHITLEQQQVDINTTYKAVLRVGHGCEGLPTTTLRVQLPAGFQDAKPMPKAGWALQTKIEKLATPYDNHGKKILENVIEISWTATSPATALPDSQYDEFILRGRAAMPVGAAWFKVTQLCQEGSKTASNLWTEIPTQGTSTRALKYPAALLNVVAPASAAASTPAPAATDPHAGHKH